MYERRAEKRAREEEPDDKPVFDDDENNSFAAVKARLQQRKESRMAQKQNELQEKLQNYQQYAGADTMMVVDYCCSSSLRTHCTCVFR